MANKDIGSTFEGDVQAELEAFKRKGMCSFVRLFDTKSARGNFLPAQPGDFIIAAGAALLIECKASERFSSLAEGQCLEDNLKSTQAAEMRLWVRAGNPAWVLFYGLTTGKIEAWDGGIVGLAYAKKLKLGEPEIIMGVGELDTMLLAMIEKSKSV